MLNSVFGNILMGYSFQGNGRAFSAGGDVAAVVQSVTQGRFNYLCCLSRDETKSNEKVWKVQ